MGGAEEKGIEANVLALRCSFRKEHQSSISHPRETREGILVVSHPLSEKLGKGGLGTNSPGFSVYFAATGNKPVDISTQDGHIPLISNLQVSA